VVHEVRADELVDPVEPALVLQYLDEQLLTLLVLVRRSCEAGVGHGDLLSLRSVCADIVKHLA
jgi:hypothetical protein